MRAYLPNRYISQLKMCYLFQQPVAKGFQNIFSRSQRACVKLESKQMSCEALEAIQVTSLSLCCCCCCACFVFFEGNNMRNALPVLRLLVPTISLKKTAFFIYCVSCFLVVVGPVGRFGKKCSLVLLLLVSLNCWTGQHSK